MTNNQHGQVPEALRKLHESRAGYLKPLDAARTHALRMEQATPKAAPGDALDEVMRERDEAEDFINELLDEVLGADRPEWSSAYNRYDAMSDVRERITALHKPAVDKAWGQFQSAMAAPQQEAQPNYVVSLVVVKEIPTGVNTQNKLYTVNAASADEAVGKAVLQMPSDFPEHRLHTACFVAAPAQPAPAPLSEREAFEAWIEKDGGDLGTFGTPPNMHYRNSSVNNAWVAWKARAALAAQGSKA